MAAKYTEISGSIDLVRQHADLKRNSVEALASALEQLGQELKSKHYDLLGYAAAKIAKCSMLAEADVAEVLAAICEFCDGIWAAVESKKRLDIKSAHPLILAMYSESLRGVRKASAPSEAANDTQVSQKSAVKRTAKSSGKAPSRVSLNESNQSTPETEAERTNDAPRQAICECENVESLREFLSEASEHIETAENLILVLEVTPGDSESINGLFRAVHSVKGAAGFLSLDSLASVAHGAESVLVRVRDGELNLKDSLFEIILVSLDMLHCQIQSLNVALQEKQPLCYPRPPVELSLCLEQADRTGQCDPTAIASIKKQMALNAQALENQNAATKSKGNNESLRVDGKRLEQLIDLIGELVITEGVVQRQLDDVHSLAAASVGARLRKVVREVQQMSLTLKMVPIGGMLQKMTRMVRDLSQKLSKPTRVLIQGADTEVDKTLLECIADPLVHLIRNAIDHGIEANVADRIKMGKPEQATITLSAEHRSGCIHITITDDGRGLDRELIRSRAIERGLVTSTTKLSEYEIDNLIFAPGFSTAAVVSDVSGRGVGMDVVRKNVEAMRGSIALHSNPGKGTEIRLELPLTLSIIDGTVVRVGERAFIIPSLSVIEQMQAASSGLTRTSNGQMALFRGRYVAAHQLGDIIGAEHSTSVPRGQVCMVVESGGGHHALFVDEILGQQPIVIKPLNSILEDFDYYAGGALLSDGEIAFVLDLNAVCQQYEGPQDTHNLEKEIA